MSSYKTARLTALFPQAYGVGDQASLLYKLLDAVGAELMAADEQIKQLLKSHWVEYAHGPALDGLASIFGVTRRVLRSGRQETDEAFRQRLRATVPLYTGGGTVSAVLGAVRSALGLPFDLDNLELLPVFTQDLDAATQQRLLGEIREDLQNLVWLDEFSPVGVRLRSTAVAQQEEANVLTLDVDLATVDVGDVNPTVSWTFGDGGNYRLVVARRDGAGEWAGFQTKEIVHIAAGQTLYLATQTLGRHAGLLSAILDDVDRSDWFIDLDGATAARLPDFPAEPHQWVFRNVAGRFDQANFGGDTFDSSVNWDVTLAWMRYTPLTFTVHVPYFVQQAVEETRRRHSYAGDLFVYEGLAIAAIPAVVEQTRAAGVQGVVQFYLNFYENHVVDEQWAATLVHRADEDQAMRETVEWHSTGHLHDDQAMGERFAFGGYFDQVPFDTHYAFS